MRALFLYGLENGIKNCGYVFFIFEAGPGEINDSRHKLWFRAVVQAHKQVGTGERRSTKSVMLYLWASTASLV
jgi:hypothetical protein